MSLTKKPKVNTAKLLQKKETKIGLAVIAICVLGVGLFATQAISQNVRNSKLRIVDENFTDGQLISPVPSDTYSQAMAQVSASPSAKPLAENTNEKLKAVKKLSYTSSATTVRVKQGDTFWSIAKRVCGNGKLADKLQRQTGYTRRWLQPGDVLSIVCN